MAVLQGGVRGLLQRRGLQLRLSRPCLPPMEAGSLDQYDVKELIGRGSSGRLFRALRKEDRTTVAIKFMGADGESMAQHRQEFEILRDLSHPNLVRALDFLEHSCGVALVLSYIPGGTLSQVVKTSRLSEPKAKPLFRQLLDALQYLHKHRVVHGDVKADNLIVSLDLEELHLTDFGSSRALKGGDVPLTATTIDFSAPEVLGGEVPSEKHDVWGAGLCLFLMLAGRLPRRAAKFLDFQDFCDEVQGTSVECVGSCWQEVSENCKAMVRHCLALDKGQRPAAMVLMAMPWLRSDEARRASAPAALNCAKSKAAEGAATIDLGSFRASETVLAKLLPVKEKAETETEASDPGA